MPAITLPVTRPLFEWRLRRRSLRLGERTLLMAIVNLTPDSFSGDGLAGGSAAPGAGANMGAGANKVAVAGAVEAFDAGADIIDLGAESTRPGALPVTVEQEQRRLLPVLEGLLAARPEAVVSIDTYHASTARAALQLGAEIVNDVSGLAWDLDMADVVAQTGAGLVLMHTRGTPQDWKDQPPLASAEVVPTVFSGLMERLAMAEATGIDPGRILLDPGFGFGKRGGENVTLLARLRRLHELGRPLMAGVSRKGFLGDMVRGVQNEDTGTAASVADARRTATTAAHTAAVLAGVHVLRVHEVQPAREAAAVADALLAAADTSVFDE